MFNVYKKNFCWSARFGIGYRAAACNNGEKTENPSDVGTVITPVEPPEEVMEQYTVTVVGGEGFGVYDKGDVVTVRPVIAQGRVFSAWNGNGKIISEESEYTFEVTEDITLTAQFADDDWSGFFLCDGTQGTGLQYSCTGKEQSSIIYNSGKAYRFSIMPNSSAQGCWGQCYIGFESLTDLTDAVVEFDVKFDNMAKGLRVFGQTGTLTTQGKMNLWAAVDGKNFNGAVDVWSDYFRITAGWYHYKISFSQIVILANEASDLQLDVAKNCSRLIFGFLNGNGAYGNKNCTGIDYTKESTVFIDNIYIGEDETLSDENLKISFTFTVLENKEIRILPVVGYANSRFSANAVPDEAFGCATGALGNG